MAGKPSSGTTTPGVEIMKLTVVTKSPAEKTARGGEDRARQSESDQQPMLSSTKPRKVEKPRTESTA